MENATMHCPAELSTLRPDDRAVFERVWRRVMPEDREGCPIVVETTTVGGDLPCTCQCPPEQTPVPAGDSGLSSAHQGSDFPALEDVPMLGRSSAVYGGQLQRQVQDALECWQMYRHLARRWGAVSGSRTLSALASEKHKSARRLAAAYFLISGVRYWPADRLQTPKIPSLQGVVRRGFQAEQQRELAYRAAASDTQDQALAELYLDLADQSRAHSSALRRLLEESAL
jgi:hypothetical protein